MKSSSAIPPTDVWFGPWPSWLAQLSSLRLQPPCSAARTETPAPPAPRPPSWTPIATPSTVCSTPSRPPVHRMKPCDRRSVFAHSLRQQELSESDHSYVADTVAARTGIPRPEAEQRVTDTLTRTQHATDTARKAVAHFPRLAFCGFTVGRFRRQPGVNFRRQATRSCAHRPYLDSYFVTGGTYPEEDAMRSILLLVLGVPIPIIILVGLLSHF